MTTARVRQVAGISLSLLALAYLAAASNIRDAGFTSGISARAYPFALGAILLISALASVMGVVKETPSPTAARDPFPVGWLPSTALVIALIVYVQLLPHLGFLLASAALIAVAVDAFGETTRSRGRRVIEAIGFGTALSILLFVTFDVLLGVNLPGPGSG